MAQDFSIKSTRNLNDNLFKLGQFTEKLSSGKNINRASDNPAALAILNQLEANDASRGAIKRNLGDGESFARIQDGAIGLIQDITTRLSELSFQSSNGTLTDTDRESLNAEYTSLTQEINRIASSTQFNGQNVFSANSTSIQSGLGSDANSQFNIPGIDIASLASGLQSGSIDTQANAQSAINAIDSFRANVNQAVGVLGAAQSSLSRLGEVNSSSRLAEAEAASRIRDVDFAQAEAERTKYSILAQVSLAVNAQVKNLSGPTAAELLR